MKAIYDDQVRSGISTFYVELPPLGYWEARLAADAPGDHVLVAVAASGSTWVGVLPEVVLKFDRWIDTGLWALRHVSLSMAAPDAAHNAP